jgi:hypothetical protein
MSQELTPDDFRLRLIKMIEQLRSVGFIFKH